MDTLTSSIGKICLNFSTIELLLSAFVTRFISDDPKIGAILTSEMSYQNNLKAFASLVKYKITDEHLQNDFSFIIRKLNEIEQKRNEILHSVYALKNPTSEQIFRIKISSKQGKGLLTTEELVNSKYFDNIINEILILIDLLKKSYNDTFNDIIIKYA